ncbi:flagellar protein export ATPase FliI [Photobacterium jeanii]|uniref:Flagellum-specific ATP synthase n=1 Tax=Photobacterium jeanii TaxID=858640 RepID=A0A178KHV9_9GAMM|nr:flagellar protein export ATPase FliI [Photobacterium jeanii]OAN16706.1 flagellar protein export ATPase FliI [Photobacterium jeanii]PST87435.1 flagellar protein export ATPase FliI [Photobacterium jeanii]
MRDLFQELNARLSSAVDQVPEVPVARTWGRLTRMAGLTLEAVGCRLCTGQRCLIETDHGTLVEAEVVGFDRQASVLMPIRHTTGLRPGSRVLPLHGDSKIDVGYSMLGRVLNGLGEPLDGLNPISGEQRISLQGETINPLQRLPISSQLDVGVRAINGMLSVGKGQRMGLFAGSGVGKSVLLGMMTRNTTAEITVVGLIGERGREVREFIEHSLGPEGMKNAVVIASPADDPPLMRLRASVLCHRIAEFFRDQGHDVLLLMDSLTRYAQAQREIALAVGEPPATKGYPPSVFSLLPQLVERAGNGATERGSITAFYTVLSEGDDQQDPIADAARAILDGHIVLNRELAEQGHYPAIDIEQSISRAMPQVVSQEQLKQAQLIKQRYARYRQIQDLIALGGYQPGQDHNLDLAVQQYPAVCQFLQQGMHESVTLAETQAAMAQLV